MQYTVITPTGKIMSFYIKSVAEMYARNTRGTLVGEEILLETSIPTTL